MRPAGASAQRLRSYFFRLNFHSNRRPPILDTILIWSSDAG
jgi:hypothetical protein